MSKSFALVAFFLVFLFNFDCFSQINKKTKQEKSETQFQSPFRYIIFSNLDNEDLELTIPQRRLEILMDKKAYNLKNLKLLFKLQADRFPTPVRLEIRVHTSLATIETPEEMETMSDHTSREKYQNYYKTALYFRYEDGIESITYKYGNPPRFWEKTIILLKSKNKK